MQQNRRKHHRIAVKEIHENPAEGIYVTKDELRLMGGYFILYSLIMSLLVLFPRKK